MICIRRADARLDHDSSEMVHDARIVAHDAPHLPRTSALDGRLGWALGGRHAVTDTPISTADLPSGIDGKPHVIELDALGTKVSLLGFTIEDLETWDRP
jgi:hypothetical protein